MRQWRRMEYVTMELTCRIWVCTESNTDRVINKIACWCICYTVVIMNLLPDNICVHKKKSEHIVKDLVNPFIGQYTITHRNLHNYSYRYWSYLYNSENKHAWITCPSRTLRQWTSMSLRGTFCILYFNINTAYTIHTDRIIKAIFLRREWLCRYIMLPAFYTSL